MNKSQIQAWIRAGCIAVVIFMAATLFAGTNKIGKVNTVPHFVHQVEHFFYYGTMAFLLAHGMGRRWWWTALFAIPLIGALDEWHQSFFPNRNASVFDWLVDVLGTIVAGYVYYRWVRYWEGRKGRP